MSARILLEYDGSDFAGWARQPGRRTVEDELSSALAQLLPRPVELIVAGRTDAGVHARGQVVSHAGWPVPDHALNGILPPAMRVLASELVQPGFDARQDATSRTYRYRIEQRPVPSPFERGRALQLRAELDRGLLDACAEALGGTHDFTAFTPTQTKHRHFERMILRSEWADEADGVIAFWIEADSFLRHMVRALVGTMLAVCTGRLDLEGFTALLEGAAREGAGDTAAAHGLYLEHVSYPQSSQ